MRKPVLGLQLNQGFYRPVTMPRSRLFKHMSQTGQRLLSRDIYRKHGWLPPGHLLQSRRHRNSFPEHNKIVSFLTKLHSVRIRHPSRDLLGNFLRLINVQCTLGILKHWHKCRCKALKLDRGWFMKCSNIIIVKFTIFIRVFDEFVVDFRIAMWTYRRNVLIMNPIKGQQQFSLTQNATLNQSASQR